MKKVQIGRSRMAEELARPTWDVGKREKTGIDTKTKTHDADAVDGEAAGKGKPKKRGNDRQVATIAAVRMEEKLLRVAAYARVSTDLDSQETSIENQCDHYRSYIASHPDWTLAGIYQESGVSGTKADTRPELQRLLRDCEAGAVDVIITKSISRFARNTSECLEMVRNLTALGITLIFEKENIDTSKMESEFLLTLLAAFAESESASISTNQKWAIRKRFQAGTYKGGKVPYGYRKEKNGYVIHPAEAATVRRIFHALCEGKGTVVIARELNADKIPTWTESYRGEPGKGRWRSNSVIAIARNEFYTGDTLYQKTFMENYQKHVNTGQLDQFLNEADHPAIIDHETFEKANEAIRQHGESFGREKAAKEVKRYALSGKLRCGICGGRMFRGDGGSYACWYHTHKTYPTADGKGGNEDVQNNRADGQGSTSEEQEQQQLAMCPMLPVSESDVKNAFTTTLNRLAAFPAVLDVSDPDSRETEAERERLGAQLQSIRRRKAVLHDRALAEKYTAQLREKKAALDAEEKGILDRLAHMQQKNPAGDLKKAVERRGVKDSFNPSDEALLITFVDHATVWSKERIRFHFTCGITTEEDMHIRKDGRSYAPLPVRTDF